MTTRRDNRATYRVTTTKHWLVTLERLHNTYCGNPRFEAILTNIDGESDFIGSFVYRFTGHYYSELDEAKWIVKHHEAKN
jgi:hypothetical protein